MRGFLHARSKSIFGSPKKKKSKKGGGVVVAKKTASALVQQGVFLPTFQSIWVKTNTVIFTDL